MSSSYWPTNEGHGDTGAIGAGEVRGMPARRIGQFSGDWLPLMQFLAKPGGPAFHAALIAARCERDKR